MNDVERLNELPNYSRMAWSTRPVWDRRAAGGHGASHRNHLAMASGHRSARRRSGGRSRSLPPMAQLVATGGRAVGGRR